MHEHDRRPVADPLDVEVRRAQLSHGGNAYAYHWRAMRSLHDSWTLGGVTIPNRVVLAPLAGIGNWFVRLQAKRHGAGYAISEMVSSHAIHHGNERTCTRAAARSTPTSARAGRRRSSCSAATRT